MTAAVNPRSITDAEKPWLDGGLSTANIAYIQDQARRLGHSEPIVLGLGGWLIVKATGGEDKTAAPTRARYRKILRQLNDEAYPGGTGGRSGRRRSERGDARIIQLAAMTAGATLALAGHPVTAAVAAAAAVLHNESSRH